jgi:hypothetical protein
MCPIYRYTPGVVEKKANFQWCLKLIPEEAPSSLTYLRNVIVGWGFPGGDFHDVILYCGDCRRAAVVFGNRDSSECRYGQIIGLLTGSTAVPVIAT